MKNGDMSIEEAMGWAAQAWCHPRNSATVMDTNLATSFAEILKKLCKEAVESYRICEARRIMAEALGDKGLYSGYRSNIACILMDRGVSAATANELAVEILHKLFFDLSDEEWDLQFDADVRDKRLNSLGDKALKDHSEGRTTLL